MKKFIIVITILVALYIGCDYAYYRLGWYIDLHPNQAVSTFMRTQGDKIYQLSDSGYETFAIKGVNLGSGEPGEWSTDFAIDKETYLRWFAEMQEMGANTVRIYTIQSDDFYEAFYEYNNGREEPLYLIQGVWVNDYTQNSHCDAYDHDFLGVFLEDCRTVVDVIHGNKKISPGKMASAGSGTYKRDVSQWVIGYILGVEWEDVTVAYTDEKYDGLDGYTSYQGAYLYSSEDASPFEVMLTQVGDKIIEYESQRYKQQRLIAFSNWPTTDPFTYPEDVTTFFMKCASVDVEHIKSTEDFLAGQFASYHVYPYYPDYLSYVDSWLDLGINNAYDYYLGEGKYNTYRAYLSMLTSHHTMPVVISEFGVSTGRGMAQRDQNTGRNQGNTSERDQGQALVDCYNDIMQAGCAGGCVFSWQDEWFKRTWNTMYAVDLKRTPYWSDYQTNEQYFGLLSFDPGKETSVCYVDGDVSEWSEADLVTVQDGMSVSMKYDEKFVYFLINKDGLDFEQETLYLPIDTTQKTGSSYCSNYDLFFDRAADFLLVLDGKSNSRLQVQERYESLRSTYSQNVANFDTYEEGYQPDVDSPLFVNIDMILQTATPLIYGDTSAVAEVYETGLLTYGNANPASSDFNSLADFICSGDYIEVKLPWQLLNFADPSRMTIHDDYYDDNYGVAYQTIDRLYVGVGTADTRSRLHLESFDLEGWGNDVTYHERLKSSYYILKEFWNTSY
ncbi:MAG: hypothetical protein PUB32_05665 [Clostridiales bacterium]|nr:hypothetical protein [Clostridiales bacterium]